MHSIPILLFKYKLLLKQSNYYPNLTNHCQLKVNYTALETIQCLFKLLFYASNLCVIHIYKLESDTLYIF